MFILQQISRQLPLLNIHKTEGFQLMEMWGLLLARVVLLIECMQATSLICILISLYLPLPGSGGMIFKSCVWFSG